MGVLLACIAVQRNVLNDYVRHYEALTYDVHSLRHSHSRVRRSLDTSVEFSFHAHGRSVQYIWLEFRLDFGLRPQCMTTQVSK